MFKMRALSRVDTERLLDIETVIEKVESAYVMKHKGNAVLWPIIFHEFEPGVRDMDIKSGCLTDAHVFGLKLVSWFGPNKDNGLPQLVSTVMVLDGATGLPKAILSGKHITMMRTGAAGAIGAKYLARKNSKTLLMVGTGHMAAFQIAATLLSMESLERVYLWSPLSREEAELFKNTIKSRLKTTVLDKIDDQESREQARRKFSVEFEVVTDIEKDAGDADIIITVTPSKKAMIMKEWIKPGTHFSCVGSDMSGKQEIDENLFAVARVFTDDVHQSISVGEAEKAFKTGIITETQISEIGGVICGDLEGRISDKDITIYDTTGIALQDLITANYVIEKADIMNIGSVFEL